MTIKIRCVTTSDRSALLRILKDTPEFKPFEIEVAIEVIDCCLRDNKNSGYFILIAEDNKDIVGYICYGPTPLTHGTWDIYWEAIAREKRGQGIGSALMKAAEQEIRKAKGRLALIETSSAPSYEKTRRFHLGLGYEIIARIPDFYSEGDDKLILQKRLK
jgi:ribosomal protein S18 acetylase RimI-like enzyme